MFEIKNIYDIRNKYDNKSIRFFIKCSYGINNSMLNYILNICKLNGLFILKVKDISDLDLNIIVNNIIKIINFYNNKLNIIININNMRKIKTYKYIRHILNLPVNGQRTHTNRNTKKKFFKFVGNNVNKHIFKF